jgi:hypothetical protein
MEKNINYNEIKEGDFLSETQYYRVIGKSYSGINVENDRKFQLFIGRGIVEEGLIHSNQYLEEQKVTMTELSEIFSSLGDSVFTVCFHKKINKKSALEEMNDLYANKGGKILSESDYKKAVKKVMSKALEGEERILTGYKIGTDRNLGRSHAIDLEQERGDNPEWDARQRQVDHRTIKWLIYKNVKYVRK